MKILQKRQFIGCLLLAILSTNTWAGTSVIPTEEWTATYDGSKSLMDLPHDMATDSDGNIYVTGTSDGTTIRVLKYDSSGMEQWTVSYDTDGVLSKDMTVDAEGNVYVLAGCYISGGWNNSVILKYSPAGDELWVKTVTGIGFSAICQYLDDDGNTYLYTTGGIANSSSSDYITMKYMASDNSDAWAEPLVYNGTGGSTDFPTAMTVDSDGNVFVTGNSRGVDTGQDIATVEYDKDGIEQWTARYAGPDTSTDAVLDIGIDSAGGVFITGSVKGTPTGMLTVKYSPAGGQEWAQIDTDGYYGYGLAIDSADNVIVTGSGRTVKYNASGVRQWAVTDADAGTTQKIAVDADDNVVVLGYINTTGVMNDFDYATVMYNADGVQQWVQNYASINNGREENKALLVYADGSSQSHIVVTGASGPMNGSYRPDFATVQYSQLGVEEWVNRFNGTGSSDSYATDVAVDSAGNVYVTGYTHTGLGTDGGYDDTDFMTIKYDANGVELWAGPYDGLAGDAISADQAVGVVVDASGNVYVTGNRNTYDAVITVKYAADGSLSAEAGYDAYRAIGIQQFVDAGDGRTYIYVASSTSSSHNEYTLIKYDADLTQQWVRRYTLADARAELAAFFVDGNGNVFMTGASKDSNDNYLLYATVKFDKSGEEIWDNAYSLEPGYDSKAKAVTVDSDGNVYVTGSAGFAGPIWDSYSNRWTPDYDCVTVKYNADGVEQWATRYFHDGYENCHGIAVDGQGNVFVGGEADTVVQYDSDYLLIKYNADGVQQWLRNWDGGNHYYDYLSAIAINNNGLVYLTGQSKVNTRYLSDYVTLAYDAEGNQKWMQRYNNGTEGTYSFHDNYPKALVVMDDDNVYVTGAGQGIGTGYDFGTVKYSQEMVLTDTTPPEITAVFPADQASDSEVATLVSATFNEAMLPGSIDTGAFTLEKTQTGTLINAAVTYDEGTLTARLQPAAALDFNTQYTARLLTAVTDLAGNAIAAERIWRFTTVAEPDTTPPDVEMATAQPVPGATDVAVSALISVQFNEPMDGNSITPNSFTLMNNTLDEAVAGSVAYDAGTWIARFVPTEPLAFATDYTATLADTITDVSNNPLANAISWQFSTDSNPDQTPPGITSTAPMNGSVDVPIDSGSISATFNEAMDATSINASSFTLTNNATGVPVDGVVGYQTGQALFTLSAALDYDTQYTATITHAVADLAGNTMGADYTWTFTTAGTPPSPDTSSPRVVSVTPEAAAANVVSSAGSITATFSEPVQGIDAASFIVSSATGFVAGTVDYDAAAMTAWFHPTDNLNFMTEYTVTIVSSLVQDQAGNFMQQDYVWNFTTGGNPALGGCEPELFIEDGCVNFDVFSYGTGIELSTYGNSIGGYLYEDGARKSVSDGEALTSGSVETNEYESEAVARVDNTTFSLRARTKRMTDSSQLAGTWSIGASKIDVKGTPPGSVIPMSIVVTRDTVGSMSSSILQVRDFDYRMLGSAGLGNTIYYSQLIDVYASPVESNYRHTSTPNDEQFRLDFLYPVLSNNGIYVWFTAGVKYNGPPADETDLTATLEISPPPGVTVTLASGQVFTGPADTDGDGVADTEDSSAGNAAIASPAAATGTGNIEIDVTANAGVILSQVQTMKDDALSLVQDGKPTDQHFPDGLVSFRLNGLEPGASATVNLTFPTAFSAGAKYYKIDENGFYEFPGAVIDGNTVQLTLTDGGAGDSDGTANGVITDPGGIADADAGNDICFISTLNPWF